MILAAFNIKTDKKCVVSIAHEVIKHELYNTKNVAFHLGKYIGKNIYLPGFTIWCPTSKKWHLHYKFCDAKFGRLDTDLHNTLIL